MLPAETPRIIQHQRQKSTAATARPIHPSRRESASQFVDYARAMAESKRSKALLSTSTPAKYLSSLGQVAAASRCCSGKPRCFRRHSTGCGPTTTNPCPIQNLNPQVILRQSRRITCGFNITTKRLAMRGMIVSGLLEQRGSSVRICVHLCPVVVELSFEFRNSCQSASTAAAAARCR